MKTYKEILSDYIPEKAVSTILSWIGDSNAQLKITRNRSSKLGDYRPPILKKYHRISVNHDLNKYHFLITFVHEYAHLKIWERYHGKVKPHGIEWQNAFRELMQSFLRENIFPPDLKMVITKALQKPNSSVMNTILSKKLREYDKFNDYLILEDLPFNSFFRIYNGMIFEKLEKMQKRYKCRRIDNNRIYMVNPIIQVIPVIN